MILRYENNLIGTNAINYTQEKTQGYSEDKTIQNYKETPQTNI